MFQSLSSEVRHEFFDLDPLADEPGIVPNVPEQKPPTALTKRLAERRKALRQPSRDAVRLLFYVGSLIDAETDGELTNETRVRWANLMNVKPKWANEALDHYHRNKRPIGDAERAAYEQELDVYRRLQPMRHLIALANDPDQATEGELDEVASQFGAVMPAELRTAIADVALAIDLAAQLAELVKSTDERLFAIYERMVDEDETGAVQTLVVNWHRSYRQIDAIYPPGWESWQTTHAREDGAA